MQHPNTACSQAADAYMLSGGIIAALCLVTGAVVIFGVPEEKTGKTRHFCAVELGFSS